MPDHSYIFRRSRFAATAAKTCFTGTPALAASFLADSNSGAACTTLPPSRPIFTVNFAKCGADLGKLAAQFSPFRHRFPHAERRGLAQHQFREFVRLSFGAQNGKQHARPVLLHLDGRVENIQRPGRQGGFHKRAEDFAGAIVQVGFQHRHAVGFPIQPG